MHPAEALDRLGAGDIALGRLDVLETLDGVEPGIEVLDELASRSVRVLNTADALLAAHDKLRTAARLEEACLPHPATTHLSRVTDDIPLALPFVVKPRFGSWGIDVFRCETDDDVTRTLELVKDRPWFERHGALVQELVPSEGHDLRLVVAGGKIVGAAERVARPGEWRTNVSLGGTRRRAAPSGRVRALGARAAEAIGADLVGVDLLPTGDRYVVLELNGAVEFDRAYDLGDSNVYDDAAAALTLPRRHDLNSGRVAGLSRSPR